MKSFIIHLNKAKERRGFVDKLIEITGAKVFDAIVPDGNVPESCPSKGAYGCLLSHQAIYKKANGDDILVFEDDCEVIDDTFMTFVNKNKANYDIIYIGVICNINTHDKRTGSWGTHAMWISNKAINLYLNYVKESPLWAVDSIWNEIENDSKLRVLRPDKCNKYVRQAIGVVSYLTGEIRGAKPRLLFTGLGGVKPNRAPVVVTCKTVTEVPPPVNVPRQRIIRGL